MAPVIWGLDLKEIQWGKFKSSYMWNNEYHLRRTKFIVYQCALIFCVVSESLGTSALDDYIHSQRFVKHLDNQVYVYNNDYVGAASFNIFAGVFVAVIFGAAFFFDLFWPERHESKAVQISWRICGVLACVFHLAACLWLTVITARNCGYFDGATRRYGESLLQQFKKDGGTPLCYRYNPRAVAATVFGWLGFVSVVASCILLFHSITHNSRVGPKSTHARREANEKGSVATDPARAASPLSTSSEPEKKSTELPHSGTGHSPSAQPGSGPSRTVDGAEDPTAVGTTVPPTSHNL